MLFICTIKYFKINLNNKKKNCYEIIIYLMLLYQYQPVGSCGPVGMKMNLGPTSIKTVIAI